MAKWRPDKGRKGQKKIKRAKTRTTKTKKTIGPSFVIRSLQSMCLWEMLQTPPPHLYNWDNCTLVRCLLVSCYPSEDDNLNRALYNEGYRCLVQKLNIDLLIRHIRFLSDRVDTACFPVPPLSLLKSLPNRVKLERLPSVNRFLTVFFLIWMVLLFFKTFIAFFLAFTLFFAFLLLVGFCYMIINNNYNSKLM